VTATVTSVKYSGGDPTSAPAQWAALCALHAMGTPSSGSAIAVAAGMQRASTARLMASLRRRKLVTWTGGTSPRDPYLYTPVTGFDKPLEPLDLANYVTVSDTVKERTHDFDEFQLMDKPKTLRGRQY
jgi:hypothetical protein